MIEIIELLSDVSTQVYAEFAVNPTGDYIVVRQIGSEHNYTHNGQTAGTTTYSIDCFSATYSGVSSLANSVEETLSGTVTTTGVYFMQSRTDNSSLTAPGMETPKIRRITLTINKLRAG